MLRALRSYFETRPHLVLTVIYAIVIIVVSYNHEVWRDEVRALSLAMESNSIFDLFSNIRNEGHPALWYLILYAGYHLVRSTIVLKIAGISIAILAVYFFLLASPFTWIQRILFILGYFPIYEYSVINRNYGISMLLIFNFCMIYKKRFSKIILLSLILFLLCQTNVHSLIIVIAIFISFSVESFSKLKNIKNNVEIKKSFIIILIIILIAIFLSVLQICPDSSSSVLNSFPSFDRILKSVLSAIILPGRGFRDALGFQNVIFVSSIVWLIYLYLLRKPYILLIFFLSVVGIGLSFRLIQPGFLRHQGFLFIMIVAIYWLDAVSVEEVHIYPRCLNQLIDIVSKNWKSLITLLLFMQVCMGIPAIIKEIKKDFSPSKKLAELIKTNSNLSDAIIIGEPDFYVEPLAYYIPNRIYIPAEMRFGKAVKFTSLKKRKYSLRELLDAALNLREEFQRPILIVMGHRLDREGPFSIKYPYGRKFNYSPNSLESFYMKTKKIASLQESMSDEKYAVFLLN